MPPTDKGIDLEEPLHGVVVLSRADFETNLQEAFGHSKRLEDTRGNQAPAVGFRVDDETALRATELAGRAQLNPVLSASSRWSTARRPVRFRATCLSSPTGLKWMLTVVD